MDSIVGGQRGHFQKDGGQPLDETYIVGSLALPLRILYLRKYPKCTPVL